MRLDAQVDAITSDLRTAGYNIGDPEMTMGQLKAFIKSFQKNSRISDSRLSYLINRTNKKKADLIREIRRSGWKNLQYYAH